MPGSDISPHVLAGRGSYIAEPHGGSRGAVPREGSKRRPVVAGVALLSTVHTPGIARRRRATDEAAVLQLCWTGAALCVGTDNAIFLEAIHILC